MNKNKLTGWKNVFSFTFSQSLKSKSFISNTIITAILFFAITLGVNVYSATQQRDAEIAAEEKNVSAEDTTSNKKKAEFAHTIHYTDKVGLGFSMDDVSAAINKKYNSITFVQEEADRETMKKGDSDAAYLTIELGDDGVEVSVMLPEKTTYSENQAEKFGKHVIKYIKRWKEESLQLSNEQKQFLDSKFVLTVSGDEHLSTAEKMVKMYVPMGMCFILYMCIILYGQMVGNSVAEEKTSKVMELLLTSIRPLAVIVGKVLSTMCLALLQLAIDLTALFAGNVVGTTIGQNFCSSYDNALLKILYEYNLMSVISPIRILCAILVFILGFTFYCTLAGLMGATVNRGEDLSSAMSVYSTISVIGFMLAYMPNVIGDAGKSITTFAAIFPLSSPFILPAKILTAELSTGMIALGIVVLAALVVVFAVIVSKIYEMVILYNGNKITFKQMRKFFKEAKTQA